MAARVPPPRSSEVPRIAAHVCFWLNLFPALFGVAFLPFAPMRIRSYEASIAGAQTESTREDARRGIVTTIVNAAVRIAAIPLLVALVVASRRESPRLRSLVFGSTIVLTIAHLFAPLLQGGPLMAMAWITPFYFLPAAAAIAAGIALCAMAETI